VKTTLAIVGAVALFGLVVLVVGGWLFYKGLTTPGSSIQQGFDKSFRSSCQSEAMKRGADQDRATRYCECTLEKFKETKSMEKAVGFCAPQFR
jgi:hypothetical protein